jgi:integrase
VVLIHSGVFVERQYCRFAGITHGQKTTDFLRGLVERGYARPIATGALHRGRVFQLYHKPLYAAIEQADNRHRKPMATGRMVERLMVVDAVLADRTCTWLGTEFDKRSHFTRRLRDRVREINLHWHDLRHEYASRLVERNVPLAQVRDLLGHASIVTTERYDNQRLEARVSRTTLMARRKSPEVTETLRVGRLVPLRGFEPRSRG